VFSYNKAQRPGAGPVLPEVRAVCEAFDPDEDVEVEMMNELFEK